MKNSKLRRALLLLACAVLLVSLSVGATLAYLQSTDSVKNTFSVGEVYIELDEKDVDNTTTTPNDGTNHTGRDKANTYHILPHATFDKDPIVWVKETSEKAYLYIQVKNEIADIEVKDDENRPTVDAQILANKWKKMSTDGDTTVYYKVFDPNDNSNVLNVDYKFETFKNVYIADHLNSTDIAKYDKATVVVTAYAIQYAGFEEKPDDAWTALNAQINAETSGT